MTLCGWGANRSLFALKLSCELEHMECWKGGRTWLEFGLDGGMFALCLVVMCAFRSHLHPYDSQQCDTSESTQQEPAKPPESHA